MSDSSSPTYDDINREFRTGTVLTASDEALLKYLVLLCSVQIQNDQNRMLAMNRCVTINTLMSRRHIERLDRSNKRYSIIVILLAILAVATSIVQILTT